MIVHDFLSKIVIYMLAHQVSRIIDGDTADSCDTDMETVASNNHVVASQMYVTMYHICIDLDKSLFLSCAYRSSWFLLYVITLCTTFQGSPTPCFWFFLQSRGARARDK